MRFVQFAYATVYIATVLIFGASAVLLAGFATYELWQAVSPGSPAELRTRFDSVLECIGLATIAVASLELSQTVLEEEVQRKATMSGPTRVRRFLSRFLIVVVVSLAIECLVAVFELRHHDPARLPQAAAIGIAASFLLAAWGLFVRLNEVAERLEPEAMARAKREDRHVAERSETSGQPEAEGATNAPRSKTSEPRSLAKSEETAGLEAPERNANKR